MANIQEKIAKLFPEAAFEEADTLTVTIPDAQWHELAKTLRDDAELAFDYLVTIVGMDWKDSLGCIYYLDSTTHNTHIAVKVIATGDRETPYIHSVSDLYAIGCIYEREVYDFSA